MKSAIKNLVLMFVSLTVALILCEIGIRYAHPVQFDSLFNHTTKTWSQDWVAEYFRKDIFRPSQTLGYEPVPHARHGINALGMFDKERQPEKPAGTYRIICVGDSTTANSYYVGILEDELNTQLGGKRFEVWNCGVSGYGALQYARAIKEKWTKYRPDMIVVGFSLTDFDTTPLITMENGVLIGYFPRHEIVPYISPFFLTHSALYRFVLMNILRFKQSDPGDDLRKEVEDALVDIKNMSSSQQTRLLVIILGLTERLDDYPSLYKKRYEAIKELLARHNIPTIDTVPMFEAHNPQSLRQNRGDSIHFNREGSVIVSNAILKHINKHIDLVKNI